MCDTGSSGPIVELEENNESGKGGSAGESAPIGLKQGSQLTKKLRWSGETQGRFRECPLQHADGIEFGEAARNGELGDQHVAGAFQHFLFAKRQRLFRLQYQQSLQDFGDLEQAAVPHLVRVFLVAVLPVGLALRVAFGQE